MKLKGLVGLILGIVLAVFGMINLSKGSPGGIVMLSIGVALIYLGFRGGRTALLVFGHTCIILGCFLITWGIYLLPYAKPTISHIFGLPLFWGLFSLMGGICANYHGFCRCVREG